MQATIVGRVRSQTASTTRNRDQASHAHRFVRRPFTRGSSSQSQSQCSHSPGSTTHGTASSNSAVPSAGRAISPPSIHGS
jgi:hypothetical protein